MLGAMVLEGLPDDLKIKIWRYNLRINAEDIILDSFLTDYIPELRMKLSEADVKYEEHLKKIHQDYGVEVSEEYVWTLPEPAILTISKQEIERIPERILRKLVENSIIMRYDDKLYKLVLEYPCG
ncbi:MAG: hypothetical protein LZ171_07025 [Thaumarchaeota archaeon]|nr:hypothetical protein [Candidatus Geocrenenecus arthurdayi]